MENIQLPDDLTMAIGSENRDFAVLAGRPEPLRKLISQVIFSFVWLAFSSFFMFLILKDPGGKAGEAGPGNLPKLLIGLFILIGIFLLVRAISNLFRDGGYYVGTPQRLIHFSKGKIRSIDWEQFTGNIEITGNASKGNIAMIMRTGQMVSKGKSGQRYVPDVIYIAAIPDAFEIERLCRKRIRENDPTPPSTVF